MEINGYKWERVLDESLVAYLIIKRLNMVM